MPNTNVFRGSDGALMLSVEETDEGTLAQTVIDAYTLTPVGRATNVEVVVQSDVKAFHEIGQRYATELRPGNVNITGSMARAYINGALLKLMLGDAAQSRAGGTWVQPSFNMVLDLTNPALPGTSSTVIVHGIKFQNWSFNLPEDDFVMEEARFMALWVSLEDKEG